MVFKYFTNSHWIIIVCQIDLIHGINMIMELARFAYNLYFIMEVPWIELDIASFHNSLILDNNFLLDN